MVSDSEQPGGRVIAALRQYGSFVNGARRRPTVPGADLAAFVRQRALGETGETSVVNLSGVERGISNATRANNSRQQSRGRK